MFPALRRLALIACLASSASAGGPWADPFVPSVRVLGEREGLPNLTVNQVVEDHQGRLWAATQDGVGVFNGHQWTPIPLPRTIRSTYIRTVLPARDGALWVGTQDDGLWELRNNTWKSHKPAIPAPRINSLLEVTGLPTGPAVLAATGTGGVYRWDGAVWHPVEGVPHPFVWRLRPDPEYPHRVWMATEDGLAVLDLAQETRAQAVCQASRGLPVNDVCRFKRPDGRVETWVTVWGQGALRWEGDALAPADGRVPLPSKNPSCIVFGPGPDGTPVLWVGTYNRGFYWLDGENNWRQLAFARMNPLQGIYSILCQPGRRPSLWVGFQAAGILAVDFEGWKNVNLPFHDPTLPTHAFAITEAQGVPQYWFGTPLGVAHWDGTAWRTHTAKDGLPDDRIEALFAVRLGGKSQLLASTLQGLAVWNGQRWAPLQMNANSAWRGALQVLPDTEAGKEGFWMGGVGGLGFWADGTLTPYVEDPTRPRPTVFALTRTDDPDGQRSLWIGTRGHGLTRFKGGKWIHYGPGQGFDHPSVYALLAVPLEGGGHRIWAGTFGGGLGWLDTLGSDGKWRWITTESHPEFSSNAILGLAKDPRNQIWILTKNRGVQRIVIPPGTKDDPSRWEFRRFGIADGLPSEVCADRACLMDRQGRLWVGTMKGAAIFDPNSLGTQEKVVPILLDSIVAGGVRLPTQPGFTLPAAQRGVTFAYFLPTLHGVEEQRFRTQLLPVEDQPTDWVPQNQRELAGLAPGTYHLRIWGRDAFGRVTAPMDVPFRINYPLWRHPWVLVLYAVLAAAGLRAYVRHRGRMLQSQNTLLQERIREAVADIEVQKDKLAALNVEKDRLMGIVAHDLRNPLGAIQLYADGILEAPEDVEEVKYMGGRIGQATSRMMEMIRRLLDVNAIDSGGVQLSLGPVDGAELLQVVEEEQGARARAKGQRLALDLAPDAAPFLADAMHLKEVVDNLVSNAIKFTPAGPPERMITLRLGRGWLEVADQGLGFREEDLAKVFGRFERLSARPTGGESSTGLGLSIVKALVEAMGGRIELASVVGEGSTFRISLPVVDA